ncbi:MAG: GAF domain-containing sensor histidine kinase [Deltaproteobacteria bacterium]|nr:GAF domain-containing sensor histidine kinase [Deltaproteobacteria bacterium]
MTDQFETGSPPRGVCAAAGGSVGNARPIETLIVVSSLLNKMALRQEQVLALSMQAIADLIRADAGAIFLLDEERNEHEVKGPCGAYGMLEGRRFAAEEGIPGWVTTQGKSVLLDEARSDARFDHTLDLDTGFQTGSLVAVPLPVKGRTIGALLFARARGGPSFTFEDRSFVRAASHQIGIALENARLQAAQEAARDVEKKVEEAKARIMSLVSHELLTPLTLLNAQLEILESELEEGSGGPCLREAIQGMRRALQRLSYVTDEILQMVLLDKGEIEFRFELVHLGGLIAGVLEAMRPLARRRSIEIVVEGDAERLTAEVSGRHLQQALTQLVLNAIRFTPDKGLVRVGCWHLPSGVRFRVADNGIGIPRGQHERIFERMVELGNIQNHHSGIEGFLAGGIGLGLPITRKIIEAHGGRIWVESEAGQGSDFLIDLPVAVL